MKHLSRFDIEAIAAKYVKAYMELPDVRNTKIYRIDPELLLEKVLGLTVEYQHLSYDGSILGMTSFAELGVQVGQGFDVPIRYKANLTIDEAVEYSGISRAGLLKMINHNDCPFVLRLGHRRLIKRRAFDEYIAKLDFVE